MNTPGDDKEWIVTEAQADLLWKSSWITLASSLYGFHKRHYSLASMSLLVFFTSILYWRKPTPSWRRLMDMTCVQAAFFYHVYRASQSPYTKPYLKRVLTVALLYPISILLHKKKLSQTSVYTHMLLHAFGNAVNIRLYRQLYDWQHPRISIEEWIR